MAWPVPASTTINQYFVSGSHLGIDIDSSAQDKTGDAVVAAQTGTVAYAGWLSGYGNVVYINSVYNGRPIQTRYAHLASVTVSAGDTVGVGQRIGTMGSPGPSTGVHLHFEVRLRSSSAACVAQRGLDGRQPADISVNL
jgi:murein DD-endopeptidase MepM/ murein hydrolase activator NlpD